MREHTFILKNQKEEQAFEDMIEKHFLEEDMLNSLVEKSFNSHFEELFLEEKRLNSYIENLLEDDMHEDQDEILNSLIEEYLLKQDIQDSIIEEQALEAERFNSLVEERIQEYADLYDAIEGFEEDDCEESLEDMLTCTILNLCLPSDILIIFKFFNFLNQCAIKALQLYYAEVN